MSILSGDYNNFGVADGINLSSGNKFHTGVDYQTCVGDMSDHKEVSSACHNCYRIKKTPPSCHQRNCPRCQKENSDRLKRTYGPALARAFGLMNGGEGKKFSLGYGRRLVFGTLTWGRCERYELGDTVKKVLKQARRFLKKKYIGFYLVAEHTYKPVEGQYYVHCHFLAYGDYYNQSLFSEEWARRTDLRDAQRDRNTGAHSRTTGEAIQIALGYIMKYITKGNEVPNEDLPQLRRIRYVSEGGQFYGLDKPKWKSYCKHCFEKYGKKFYVDYATEQDVDAIYHMHMGEGWMENEFGEYKEPLQCIRELSWSVKWTRKVRINAQERFRSLEEWWKREKWRSLCAYNDFIAWGLYGSG